MSMPADFAPGFAASRCGSSNRSGRTQIPSTCLFSPRSRFETEALLQAHYALWRGDVKLFLQELPLEPLFDLVITSPPYNIGKKYESRSALAQYLLKQEEVIDVIIPRLKDGGSLCWQVGNYVKDNEIFPLDIEFAPIFKKHGLQLRNRIVWHYGHGQHTPRRFSGRYEVVMWYTKTDAKHSQYTFNLDAVRVPPKYPAKKHYKGPNSGKYSCNPNGKNPEDVWDIPNVKSAHVEKTIHPCQFPVGLVERLVLALTEPGQLVFDPYAGVASTGVACAVHNRRFWGCEVISEYVDVGGERINSALVGKASYRPHDKPLYDNKTSKLSIPPKGFRGGA